MSVSVDKEELKDLIKQSVSELFVENRELFAEIIEEVIEERLFMELVKSGEASEIVPREAIFATLDNESRVS